MRIGHTAINSFLGRSVRNEISRLVCASECGFAEQKTADRNYEMPTFAPESGGRDGSGLPVKRHRQEAGGSDRSDVCLPGSIPSLARSLLRGYCDARRHGTVLLSGLLSQSKSGPLLQKARLGTWESRPLAWLRPGVTRAVREFKNGDTIMYQNKATLMGFLGNDAEVRTGKNNQKFTTFSVATKTSYKDKESGEYVSQTEWHRCIVFGKFGDFAATLKKGAHVQVEGEIRHTEYTPKKAKKPVRTDSIRVTSILKLDHAEKAAAEEQFEEEIPSEVEAA